MKAVYVCFITGALWICALSCKDNRKASAEKLVKEWVGKEISFPEVNCVYMGIDTVCADFGNAPYKILVYTDSIGCTSCKLNLNLWKYYMQEIDSIAPDRVSFLFYFQPKSRRELAYLLRRENLDYSVFIDGKGELNRVNKFPVEMEYQCFLLDQNNEVVSIGNPTLNPKIWEIYKQVITNASKL